MAEYAHRNNLTIYEHVVGSMGGLIIKGSVKDVGDQMEDWYRSEVCDGFVLSGPVMRQTACTGSCGWWCPNCSDVAFSGRTSKRGRHSESPLDWTAQGTDSSMFDNSDSKWGETDQEISVGSVAVATALSTRNCPGS